MKGVIKYFIDGKAMFYVESHEREYTQEEFDKMENERIEKDRQRGYADRKGHIYDKWYRYNRPDDGKAYDEGVSKFLSETQTKKWFEEDDNFRIIEA